MSTVLKRLQQNVIPGISPIENGHWSFSAKLAEQSTDFFRPNLKKYQALQFEYAVACTQLCQLSHTNAKLLKEQIIAALILAEFLEFMFRHYFGETHEIDGLRKDQIEFRKLLSTQGISFSPMMDYNKKPGTLTKKIRTKAVDLNLLRLIVVRAKRIFSVLANYITNSPLYNLIINNFDKYANPFFNHLSWIFFIPRSITNLVVFFKRTVPGPWMSKRERELSFAERSDLQLQRRGFELGNDIPWGIVNGLGCILIAMGLALAASYLNAAFFLYDVVLAAIRAAIVIHMFHELMKEYTSLSCEMQEVAENLEFRKHFQKRKNIELAKLFVSANSLAALAIVVVVAATVAHPLLPLIAAILLFIITVLAFLINKVIEKHRPKTQISEKSLSSCYRLFKPAVKVEKDESYSLEADLETFSLA